MLKEVMVHSLNEESFAKMREGSGKGLEDTPKDIREKVRAVSSLSEAAARDGH